MLIVLAAVLALLVLAAAGLLALHVLALEPAWLAGLRHRVAQARYRADGVLAEFGDWLRLGR